MVRGRPHHRGSGSPTHRNRFGDVSTVSTAVSTCRRLRPRTGQTEPVICCGQGHPLSTEWCLMVRPWVTVPATSGGHHQRRLRSEEAQATASATIEIVATPPTDAYACHLRLSADPWICQTGWRERREGGEEMAYARRPPGRLGCRRRALSIPDPRAITQADHDPGGISVELDPIHRRPVRTARHRRQTRARPPRRRHRQPDTRRWGITR